MKSKRKIYNYNPGIHGKNIESYYQQVNRGLLLGERQVFDSEKAIFTSVAEAEKMLRDQFEAYVLVFKAKDKEKKKNKAILLLELERSEGIYKIILKIKQYTVEAEIRHRGELNRLIVAGSLKQTQIQTEEKQLNKDMIEAMFYQNTVKIQLINDKLIDLQQTRVSTQAESRDFIIKTRANHAKELSKLSEEQSNQIDKTNKIYDNALAKIQSGN